MRRLIDRLRESGPSILVFAAAGIYAFSLVTGGIGYRLEKRTMPQLAAAWLDTGEALNEQRLRGHPVILNVWAPYCAPCRRELPSLDKVASDYAGRVEILGLMGWGTREEGRSIVEGSGLHMRMLAGGAAFLESLDVETVPTTFFIRADGTIAARQVGMKGEGFFREQADKLLAGTL